MDIAPLLDKLSMYGFDGCHHIWRNQPWYTILIVKLTIFANVEPQYYMGHVLTIYVPFLIPATCMSALNPVIFL